MFQLVSLFILALAVSLDSFGVGITYGMRGISIPIRSIVIIALCSGVVILLAMSIGQGLHLVLPPYVARNLGGLILIGIGIWALTNVYRSQKNTSSQEVVHERKEVEHIWSLEIKMLGIVIQLLRKPTMADFDQSGVISPIEAIVLGIALALDAFGAGIGAALIGFSSLATAGLIGLMSGLFIYLGITCGHLCAEVTWLKKTSFFPGLILIALGLLKLF